MNIATLELPTWLPITAIVAISVFVVREVLEWRRRRAADGRRVNALKRILARECQKNHSTLAALIWTCEALEKAALAQDPMLVHVEERNSGGFSVAVDLGNNHSVGWSSGGIVRDALHKHLPEIAALDDEFFAECERTIEMLEPAEWAYERLMKTKIPAPDDQPDWNLRPALRRYLGSLTDASDANRALYKICTAREVREEIHPASDAP